MHSIICALSLLALLWIIPCSAQQSTSVVATLQLPDQIFSKTPRPTWFAAHAQTSIVGPDVITGFTIPCVDIVTCYSDVYDFTADADGTTYGLSNDGTVICRVTNADIDDPGTTSCTETAGTSEYFVTPGSSYWTGSESSSYVFYFSTIDEELAISLDAMTITYNPTSPTASTAASSTSSTSSASTSIKAGASSSPSSTAASKTLNGAPPSTPSNAAASAQQAQTTDSHHFTEHEKIGVGVGIVGFVIVCCCVAVFVFKFYRHKRRAAHPNPSELYFNTGEKGQASGAQL